MTKEAATMTKNLYEKLCSYYEFMLGPLPWREEFERALRETVSEEELRILFRVPFSGAIPHAKLAKKAQLPADQLRARLDRLAAEGMIMAYTREGQTVYERGNPVFMTEQQVRKEADTPRRQFYARFFNSILNGEVVIAAPTKTPYYRVLPVEGTLTGERGEEGRRVIPVEVDVPDPRAVLPIDIVSEMIRSDANIAW
jgi:hypothetical protein